MKSIRVPKSVYVLASEFSEVEMQLFEKEMQSQLRSMVNSITKALEKILSLSLSPVENDYMLKRASEHSPILNLKIKYSVENPFSDEDIPDIKKRLKEHGFKSQGNSTHRFSLYKICEDKEKTERGTYIVTKHDLILFFRRGDSLFDTLSCEIYGEVGKVLTKLEKGNIGKKEFEDFIKDVTNWIVSKKIGERKTHR